MCEIFTGNSGNSLALHIWDSVISPVAVLQLVHGMHDNMAYYANFATAMNARNIIVIGLDCPLCGESCDNLSYQSETDFFSEIVKDNLLLLDTLGKRYGLPVFLVGLGSGSLVVERCIQIASEHLCGAVLIGATYNSSYNVKSNAAVLSIGKKFDVLNFNTYYLKKFNKRFKNEKNDYAWLCNNNEYVESVSKEKQNNMPRPICYYLSLNNAMNLCIDDNNISTIRKSLPLLIMSGEQDSLGGFGKKVLKLYDSYVNAAMTNVKMRLFQGSRHALLHDNAKNEAMRHIGDFIEEHCNVGQDK